MEEEEGWGWRFRMIVALFIIANAASVAFMGPKPIVMGWLLNIPCGLFHYFVIERPHNAGDPIGTIMVVAMPWAQTILTSLVVVAAYSLMLWRWLFGSDEEEPGGADGGT